MFLLLAILVEVFVLFSLGTLCQIGVFYGDKEFNKRLIMFARVVFPYNQIWQTCEVEIVDVHDTLRLDQVDER